MKTTKKLITNRSRYLTGMTSLNILNDEMTGDWHFHNHFTHQSKNYFITTQKPVLWGNNGIVEVSDKLATQGVYSDNPYSKKIWAADHYRAIAELFLNRLEHNQPCQSLFTSVDDWLYSKKQKNKLFKYLKQLSNPEINRWMDD